MVYQDIAKDMLSQMVCEIETVNLIGCRYEEGWLALLNPVIQDNSSNAKQTEIKQTKGVMIWVISL